MATAVTFKSPNGSGTQVGGALNLKTGFSSGTDQAGAALTLSGGQGTGTGTGGSIVFQVADGGSSGSSPNTLATALTIADNKAATFVGGVLVQGELMINSLFFGLTRITSTGAELNLVDGSSAGTIVNSKAVVYGSSGEVNATELQIAGTSITSTAAELNLVDGSSAGTIVNSKAVVYGSIGEVNATTLQIAGTSITSTAAELNILDGVTATTAELNIIDGDTSATDTTVASGDRVVYNDAGTMMQVDVDDIDTYFSATSKTLTNKTLTTPKIANAGFIADANGNEALIFNTTASAVNHFSITNASTGNKPKLAAVGDNTNIDLGLTPKGLGNVDITTGGLSIYHTNAPSTGKIYIGGNFTTSFATNATSGYIIDVVANTVTDGVTAASGTRNEFFGTRLAKPTIQSTNSSVTVTKAATLYIEGAPGTNSNVSLTTNVGLLIDGGGMAVKGDSVLTGSLIMPGSNFNGFILCNSLATTTCTSTELSLGGSGGTGKLEFVRSVGTNFLTHTFQGGNFTANQTYTLPINVPTNDYVLKTDSNGVLSWAAQSGGGGGGVSGNTFASDLKIGRDADNLIDFATTDNKVIFRVNGVNEVELVQNALSPVTNDGVALGTTSLGWSDLYLADGSIIHFGNDQDVTLTHVADTGILLNSSNAIQFNDASQYINAPNATTLDINATDEIELNATLCDVNANLEVSGTYTGGGDMTTGGNIVIPDAGKIGSASDTDAISISSGGVVNVSATTASTSSTTGALTVAGGVGIADDLFVGDNLSLISDSAVLSLGADSDATLTHDGPTGLTIAATPINLTSSYVAIGNGSTGPGELRIYEDTDNGTNYTAFKVGTQSGDITYTLPTAYGSSGQQLTTDDSGNLSWAASASGVTIDDLSDAKKGGVTTGGGANTAFDGCLLLGRSSTGTLTTACINNIGIGFNANITTNGPLRSLTSGAKNVVIGSGNCGDALTEGNDNTILGNNAGSAIVDGIRNVIVGASCGSSLTTGTNNICIGFGANVSAAGVDNEITLGNGNVTELRCADTSITSLSDARDKTDIIDLPWGLDFVDSLRPVQFTWDRRVITPDDENWAMNGKKRAGFLAQELQTAMTDNANDVLDLVYESNPERLEVKMGKLVPMLTQAIKELKAEVDTLKAEVAALKNA
jgi:hypothetical protein